MTKRIRLSALADVTHRTRAMVKNQTRDVAPWESDHFGGGGQRLFDTRHVLALTLSEMIAAQGVKVAQANETVAMFFDKLEPYIEAREKGRASTDLFIMHLDEMIEDRRLEIVRIDGGAFFGSHEEIENDFSRTMRRALKSEPGRDQNVGTFRVAVASLAKAYDLADRRAKNAGFVISGMGVFKMDKEID